MLWVVVESMRSVADMTTWIEELKRSEYEAPT